jgi:putative copper resistance protein D
MNPTFLRSILADTQFGRAWQLVLGIVLMTVVATMVPWRGRWLSLALLSGALLAALGLVGHLAAPSGGLGLVGRASQSIHLVAAGFWLGSLLPLVLSLRRARADDLRAALEIALRRFSGLGHLAVALVLATGVVNTATILGRPPTDPASPYELLLIIKIALTLLMVGLALVNRYALMPRLGDSGLSALYRTALVEYAVGAAVLAIVAGLGTLQFA